jgi:hypothetical protein
MKVRSTYRHVNLLLLFFTAATLFSAVQSLSAESLRLNLEEAIALGLSNSTVIPSNLIAVDSSRTSVKAVKSGYYPGLSASVNWTHYLEQSKSPTVSFQVGTDTLTAPGAFVLAQAPVTVMFDLTQPICTFGRIKHGVQLATESLQTG